MSFELLRRQQIRLQEVDTAGTYDSVVAAVEAAAVARAHTDEGRMYTAASTSSASTSKPTTTTAATPAGKKAGNNKKSNKLNKQQQEVSSQKKDLQQFQHHGSISLNENVARKVAEARISGNANKNIQDHQRRFLHSRNTNAQHVKQIQAAREVASKIMKKKNDTSTSSDSSGKGKKHGKKAKKM